jgi:hypothetical protein
MIKMRGKPGFLMLRKFGTEKPSTWTTSFVVDTPKLTRLCDEIDARFARVGATPVFTFIVAFRDKRRERRNSVEEVFNLDNGRSNPVTGMSIQANGKTEAGHPLSCSIEFSNAQQNNVRLAVKGEDPMGTNDLHAALDERVQATFAKRWGQVVAACTLIAILISGLFFLDRWDSGGVSAGLTRTDFAELNQMAEHADNQEAQLAFIFELHRREIRKHIDQRAPIQFTRWMTASAVATSILFIGVAALLAYLVLVCYPRAVFNWGEYGEHFENLKLRRKYIRNLVIGGVILSLVVNVAATGFSAQFRGRR